MKTFATFLLGIFFSVNAYATTCVDNLCAEGNIVHATAYKAYLSVPEYIQFPLGSTATFVTTDDPNGNAQQSPGVYTVPLTGYYALTFAMGNVGIDTGLPPDSILRVQVLRNGGSLLTLDFAASAATQANKVLSGVVLLNSGDQITSQVRAFSIEPMGLIERSGTVTLSGPASFFAIHYLSSLGPVVCCN